MASGPSSTSGNQRKSKRRNLITIVAVVVILILILAIFLTHGGTKSGDVNLTSITVQWSGVTYTLLDTPYSSSNSSGGYGNSGFNFNTEFVDSGTCPSSGGCFDPGSTAFALTSITSGFQVNWVTACYQSKGYAPLVGPVFGKYFASPPSVPNGCNSAGPDVAMAGLTAGSEVFLTVDVQFSSAALGYSGPLELKATPVANVTITNKDPTITTLSCSPGTIAVDAVALCTVTVNDTATSPKATAAPAGYVNFTAPSGTFGPGRIPSCDLQALTTSSASCSVNYESATLGSVLIFADYGGDSIHQTSSAGFQLQTFEYALTVSPSSQSVAQGQTATYQVTATLMQGSATSNIPEVTLGIENCNPYSMTCTFSGAMITPTLAGNSTTLAVTPIPNTVQVPYSSTISVTGTTGTGDYALMIASNDVTIMVT